MSTTRRNRQTGTLITVASAHECCCDETDPEARWFTICEDHSENIAHATKRQAEWFAASPIDWCSECLGREANAEPTIGGLRAENDF